MKLGVLMPMMASHPGQVERFAALTRDAGADRFWMGESLLLETHQVTAFLTGRGLHPPVGTSVSLMPLRHPLSAAAEARSVAVLTGKSMVAGFGPGASRLVKALHGAPYGSPLTAAREYMMALRCLLDGSPGLTQGTYFRLHTRMPPLDHPPIELGLGVLRPAMAHLAGQVADTAITWLTPPDYLRDQLIPAMRKGAAEAERRPPRVVSVIQTALASASRDPRDLAEIATRAHLAGPHYAAMLRRAGINLDDASPQGVGTALVDHDLFVSGTQDEIAGRLRRYAAIGVDEVVLNTAGVAMTEGLDAARGDYETILGAVRP